MPFRVQSRACLSALVFLLGCAEEASAPVAFELVTDFVPGLEFNLVTVEVEGGDAPERVLARAPIDGDDYLSGVFLGEVTQPAGERLVRVTLYLGDESIDARSRTVGFPSEEAARFVITRDCEDVNCPGTQTCVGGRCEDCDADPAACLEPECFTSDGCRVVVDCAIPTCVDQRCLQAADDTRCAAGEVCHPSDGCIPRPVDVGPGSDSGGMDGNVPRDVGVGDGGVDAENDVGNDVGIDAGNRCLDGMQNGGESGVDCGGVCGPCDRCGDHAGAIFCSGFEVPDFPEWSDTSITGGGVIAREESLDSVYRGLGAMRTFIPDSASETQLEYRFFETPQTGGDLYARFYMKVDPSTEISGTRHIFRFGTETADQKSLWLAMVPNGRLEMSVDSPAVTRFFYTPNDTIREGQWQCVQLRVTIAQNGFFETSVDGVSERYGPVDLRSTSQGFRQVLLGLPANFSAPNVALVRYDELVVDTAPIGCD